MSKELFRQAWGKFATGVSVVTTLQEDGKVHYMTANALCSVSLEPFLVLLCLDHLRNTHRYAALYRRFGINILTEGQAAVATRYAGGEWQQGELPAGGLHFMPNGTAALNDALACMACRVVAEHQAGDHTIFVAEVEEIEVKPGMPLIFYEGQYASLTES
jgi:flavin reductase (DIM6/NTAB) family NADH-FMN oxidoreductase RutF